MNSYPASGFSESRNASNLTILLVAVIPGNKSVGLMNNLEERFLTIDREYRLWKCLSILSFSYISTLNFSLTYLLIANDPGGLL